MRPSFVRRFTPPVRLGPALLALAIAACNSDSAAPVAVCSAAFTPAILAHVTDSVTGQPLAQSALGVIQDRTIVDSLRYYAPPDEMYAGSKPGTYAIHVAHTGYADWSRTGVIVTPTGFCSTVNTVTIQVKLVPTP